jgi:PIN domain nuclease of toxin-antitoxin system
VKILLDTHVWIWYLTAANELPKKFRQKIEEPATELYLSAISQWEAHLLLERGRVPTANTPRVWIQEALQMLQVRDVSVTSAILVRSREMKIENQDPADRIIAATAVEGNLMLMTADKALQKCREVKVFRQ